MRLACLFLILAPPILLLTPPSVLAQSRDYPPDFEGARRETYKQIDDVSLDLWVFEPQDLAAGDVRPAIVFFFGGGWKAGTPAQFEQQCRYLAEQGMVAITADYRVRNRHHTLADKAVTDAKSAIRWVRENATRLGVDPNRIVAAGGSAGGHLAACTGVVLGLDDPSEDASISSSPNAMALFNPALLLAPFDGTTLSDEKIADIATRTGVPAEQISPIHQLRSDLPPTIIFHGEADPVVPFETARRYAEVATMKGNRCELIGYPGAEHGFFNFGRNGNPGEHYVATLHRLHEFLQSLGYLDHDPTVAVPESGNVHLRSHLDNSRITFEQEQQGTVAFIGGSITEMAGYRVMVEKDLRKRFPDTKFSFINAGIASTCSTTGAARLFRDVLSHDPDLLFVEFAVNDDQDAAHAERDCRRGMEGILRHAVTHDPYLDVVVTHFVNPSMLKKLQHGETPISSGTHEFVANHYGVCTIDLAREVAERVSEGKLTWKEYGGTHPGKIGNRIAADMIDDLLTTAWTPRFDGQPQPGEPSKHRQRKMLDSQSYSGGKLVAVSEADIDDSWVIHRPDWSSLKGGKRQRFNHLELLCTDTVGAELTLRFNGPAIGMYVLAGPDAGRVEFSIDGEVFRTAELFHRHSKGLHYPRTIMLDADLESGKHELKMRVAPDHDSKSTGNAVRILNFVTNSKNKDSDR